MSTEKCNMISCHLLLFRSGYQNKFSTRSQSLNSNALFLTSGSETELSGITQPKCQCTDARGAVPKRDDNKRLSRFQHHFSLLVPFLLSFIVLLVAFRGSQ